MKKMARQKSEKNPTAPRNTAIAAIPRAARENAAAVTKKTRTHAAVRKIRGTPKGTAAKAPTNLADAANPKAG